MRLDSTFVMVIPISHVFGFQLGRPLHTNAYPKMKEISMKRAKAHKSDGIISNFTQDMIDQEVIMKLATTKYALLSIAASIMCVPPDVLTTPPMIDPSPPSNPIEFEWRKKEACLLLKGWGRTDGYQIPAIEIEEIDELMGSERMGKRPSTYGEVTELGAWQLF